jgi:hypothetical protein
VPYPNITAKKIRAIFSEFNARFDFLIHIIYTVTVNSLPLIFDFCIFCHNPVLQTVSNADSKSTKVKNIFLPNEKYIVINAYSTNTLSVVENPLRSPACDPEIRLIVSENIFNLLFRIDEKVLLK